MAIQRITSGIIADGAIVATDIADGIVTNDKLAGSITSDKITSVSNTAISGLIQAAQIGSANASVINAGTLAGARLPAGSVLQVVQARTTTDTNITSDSFVDTTLTASITPSSASSKILVMVTQCYLLYGQATQLSGEINIVRNSTQLITTPNNPGLNAATADTAAWVRGTWAMNFLDSPATTSSTTYKTQAKLIITGSGRLIRLQQDSNQESVITLLEIAA